MNNATATDQRSQRIDRYLAIVSRARRLYSRNGVLPLSRGLRPLAFLRCEQLAWEKYVEGGKHGGPTP